MEVPIIRICNFLLTGLFAVTVSASPALAKRGDDGTSSLNRYVEARLAELSGEPQTAVALYADNLKQQPGNALLAGKAYVKAIETGDFDLAVRAVRTLELNGKIDAEMPFLPFTDAFDHGDWRSAKLALFQLESLKNFAFMVPMLENWAAVAKGDWEAINISAINENASGKFYYTEQRILLKLASGDDDDALPMLMEVVKRNEARMAPIRIIAARHFLAKNEVTTALSILKLKRTGPEVKLARDIKAGRTKGVARKIDAGVGAGFVFNRLSTDLGAQRATFLALVLAQCASRIDPKNDYGRLRLGRAYQNSENSEFAQTTLAKVQSSSPYYLVALNAEIASYSIDRQFILAQSRLDTGIQQNPDTPELRILRGQLLQRKNANKDAAVSFLQAIKLAVQASYPKVTLANYWLALGSAQEQAGIWPEGLQSLKKANELLPNSASILNYLGYAQLERRENTAEAIAAIKKAHELRPSSPAITDSLGWAYFITGDHARAVDYLERALSGQPQDATINEHLGDAYWTVGRRFEARYAWKAAKLFAKNGDIERLSSKISLGLKPELVSP